MIGRLIWGKSKNDLDQWKSMGTLGNLTVAKGGQEPQFAHREPANLSGICSGRTFPPLVFDGEIKP